MTRLPTIRTARAICKQGELDGVLIIGIANGQVQTVTYGRTMKMCRALAPLCTFVHTAVEQEEVDLSAFNLLSGFPDDNEDFLDDDTVLASLP